ncbi:MAG: GHMP kinase [Chloroflexota bacterium]
MSDRRFVARAPVRVSFGGGGTDLPAYYRQHGGQVLSTSINRFSYAMVGPSHDRGIHLTSADYRVWESHPRGALPRVAEPLSLPKAALAWAAERGSLREGVELFLAAEVSPGTGLGSSSAMAVALLTALAGYLDINLTHSELAEAACELEIERLGMPIGKQDQYASAFGGLNAISFAGDDSVCLEPLRLSPDVVATLNSRLLLFSTGKSRQSSSILEQQRHDSSRASSVIDSLHNIKRLGAEMRAALEGDALDDFGDLLDQAWRQKRMLSNKISNPDIDRWYGLARRAGAAGGKITGAGGGGFLLVYCLPAHQSELRHSLAEEGLRELRFELEFEGATLLENAGIELGAGLGVQPKGG